MISHRDGDVPADVELRNLYRFFFLEGRRRILIDLSDYVDDFACNEKFVVRRLPLVK